jgi:hypothetical protein
MRNQITIILLFLTSTCFSQVKQSDLVLLAEAYHKYSHTNIIDYSIFEKIEKINSTELKEEKEFIAELIKPNNDILNTKFLTKPDLSTLQNIFIIRALNYNMFKDNPLKHKKVIKKVKADKISYQEMLSAYYNMIFGVLVNKHEDLDLSNESFYLDNLNLLTKQEKGIFFLTSMERFGAGIWGYMNIPTPTDYKSALEVINRYPKYNGEEYYKYNDFDFSDFQITVDIRKPKVSFKDYYLKKYFETLGNHLEIMEIIEPKKPIENNKNALQHRR